MSKAFQSIQKGLKEALEHATGATQGKVHEIQIPETDVQLIRSKTGLSQADFAKSIGVKKSTLLNWEQKRRVPDGPARVLLALISKDPNIVQRTLS